MKWKNSKKVFLAFDFIKYYSILEKDVKIVLKNIDLIEYYFYLTKDEFFELMRLLNKGEKTGFLSQAFINQGIKKGKMEGMQEGLKVGEIKGKLETARKMHKKGFSIKDILEITELSKEELEKAGIV